MTEPHEALAYYRDKATYRECKRLHNTLKTVVFEWEMVDEPLKVGDWREDTERLQAVRRDGTLVPIAHVIYHPPREEEWETPDGELAGREDPPYYSYSVVAADGEVYEGKCPTAKEAIEKADRMVRSSGYTVREAEVPGEVGRIALLMGDE